MSSTKKDNIKESTNQFKESTNKYLTNRTNKLRIQHLTYLKQQTRLTKS
jgi:hypothetical protein